MLRPDGSYAVIDPSEHAERLVFAFVRTGCDSCAQLLRELAQNGLPEQTFALVNGEGFNEYAHSKGDRFEALWLAHPPDVVRSYGVTAVPLVYVVHRGRVLAAKATATRKGVEALLADADLIEQELAREAAGNGSTPVAAGEP